MREIERTEGVSTATATRVAAVLRGEGLAESIPGIGTVVAARPIQTTGPDRLAMLRAGGDGFRAGEEVRVLISELVPAPDTIAHALGVPEGADVVQRQRLYRDDLGVVALSTSWLPGRFAEAPQGPTAPPRPGRPARAAKARAPVSPRQGRPGRQGPGSAQPPARAQPPAGTRWK
ncbi:MULTISPECIES: UTRA domain-containing protein [Streptomyces]|uniref:UTRA domain-containing protein n=1 Tax=Streptomyces TaxID=1883 RepID=UPI00221EF16E|nr:MULTISPECIES: UTRA domain-containing protein [Streptomyces]